MSEDTIPVCRSSHNVISQHAASDTHICLYRAELQAIIDTVKQFYTRNHLLNHVNEDRKMTTASTECTVAAKHYREKSALTIACKFIVHITSTRACLDTYVAGWTRTCPLGMYVAF